LYESVQLKTTRSKVLAINVYEGMFLLESGRFGRDPEGVSGQIPAMIGEAEGEILVSRMWEERRLAYPIRGQRKGTYWLTYFRVDGRRIPEIERKCQLSDSVMRALFIKIDPRIVDALVEHANAGPTVGRPDGRRGSGSVVDGSAKDKRVVDADKPAVDANKRVVDADKPVVDAAKGAGDEAS
jgi:small subunit ribosomal protein S6